MMSMSCDLKTAISYLKLQSNSTTFQAIFKPTFCLVPQKVVCTINFSSNNPIRDKSFATPIPKMANAMKSSRKMMKWNHEQEYTY